MLFLKVVADYTPGKNTFQHLFSVYVVLFFLIAFPPDITPASRHPWALPCNEPRIQGKKSLL
jgi:hypothetical protein